MKICEKCDAPARSKGMCQRHYDQSRYAENRDKFIAASARWAKANKESRRGISGKYRSKNREACYARSEVWRQRIGLHEVRKRLDPEKLRARQKKWDELNPGYLAARSARGREKVACATPKWVSHSEIRSIYEEARRIYMRTGIKYDVDHIVPISNPNVCGLHVPWNLRAIPASDNRVKSNKLIDGELLAIKYQPQMRAS